MADRVSDPSLPRSTLVYPALPNPTQVHPYPPWSTQVYPISTRSSKVYPILPRSSKDYHGPTQTKVRNLLGAGIACVGSFAILQTQRLWSTSRLCAAANEWSHFAKRGTLSATIVGGEEKQQHGWCRCFLSNSTQLAHPALQLMRRRCLALLLDGCCWYQKGKVVFVVKRIRGCTVPLCPQRGPGLFCYRANTAQKGPHALLKAMRRSTSSISNQRSCPITPSSRGRSAA